MSLNRKRILFAYFRKKCGNGQLLGGCCGCFVPGICLVMLTAKLCTRGLTDALVLLFHICIWFPECVRNKFIMLPCFINISKKCIKCFHVV